MASETERLVRKLRKKLRQIENLEILDRDLNEEEIQKVERKEEIRREINKLLPDFLSVTHNLDNEVDGFTLLNVCDLQSDDMKRKSSEVLEVPKVSKKSCPSPVSAKPANSQSEQENVDTTDTTVSTSEPEAARQSSASTSGQSSGKKVSVSERETQSRREREERRQSVISCWRGSSWRVEELEGHEDLVLDCDLGQGVALTASRDTTVKVWRLDTGQLLNSLRGHTGPVTGVRSLNQVMGILIKDSSFSPSVTCFLKEINKHFLS